MHSQGTWCLVRNVIRSGSNVFDLRPFLVCNNRGCLNRLHKPVQFPPGSWSMFIWVAWLCGPLVLRYIGVCPCVGRVQRSFAGDILCFVCLPTYLGVVGVDDTSATKACCSCLLELGRVSGSTCAPHNVCVARVLAFLPADIARPPVFIEAPDMFGGFCVCFRLPSDGECTIDNCTAGSTASTFEPWHLHVTSDVQHLL